LALRAAVYLAALGPHGLKETAELSTRKAHYAARELMRIPGVRLRFARPFFKEFTLELPQAIPTFLSRMLRRGYHAGLPLGQWLPALASCVSVAVTEKRSRAEIDSLVSAYEAELSDDNRDELLKKPGEILLA
jgi:glycine dehydrogenase subunit 1